MRKDGVRGTDSHARKAHRGDGDSKTHTRARRTEETGIRARRKSMDKAPTRARRKEETQRLTRAQGAKTRQRFAIKRKSTYGAHTRARRNVRKNKAATEYPQRSLATGANRGPGDQSGRKRKKKGRVLDGTHYRCPKKGIATTGGDPQSMPTLRLWFGPCNSAFVCLIV